MNNKEFIAALNQRTGIGVRGTQAMVDQMCRMMAQKLQDGGVVCLPQFGNFEVRKKMERVIVNPTTKKKMLVPPKLAVGFKPAQMLKDKVR